MIKLSRGRAGHGLIAGLAMTILALAAASPAYAEGSRDLYPSTYPAGGSRANLEWRTSSYGPAGSGLIRRTLLQVYVEQDEFILMGSTAVSSTLGLARGVGDILIYAPGQVTGIPGRETVPGPASALFSCNDQRNASGNAAQGRILSRAMELIGPDTAPSTIPGSYTPCTFQAPATGLYHVVITGPSGFTTDERNPGPNGQINFAAPPAQAGAVAAWDVTVRATLASATDLTGRLFTYVLTMHTGSNARQIFSNIYLVTTDGFRYLSELSGVDPNAFVVYGSQVGFFDSDGVTPLYRNVVATDAASNQDQLSELRGGVDLAPPSYPIFFNPPADETITALGIPLAPTAPVISSFEFQGQIGNTSLVGAGGTFTYTSNVAGNYQLVISRDGVDFEPTNPLNRVLRGVKAVGVNTIIWDGDDNSGNDFPVGTNYPSRLTIQSGEYHFPWLDVENNQQGGPTLTLLNPPGGVCPGTVGGCSTAFYDDRGYRTAAGTLVGQSVNGPICAPPNDGSPPAILYSGINGFDSSTNQRAFGFASGGTPAQPSVCAAGSAFGDKKGLDFWTYYPSTPASALLNIVNMLPPPAQADLAITKDNGVTTYTPGGSTTYTIMVDNLGPDGVTGAVINDARPAQITGWTWTCTSQTGGASNCDGGTGNPFNDTVDMPAGSRIVYTVVATLDPAATGNMTNSVSVSPPPGTTDPTPGNNTATDTDTPPGGSPPPTATPVTSGGTPATPPARPSPTRTPPAAFIPETGIGPGWQDYWLSWALWLLLAAAPVALWRLSQRRSRR